MTPEQFKRRAKELVARLSAKLEKEAERLYRCGGVDTESHGDDYGLPKIILTVAIENVAADFRPLYAEHKADVQNLRNF